MSSGNVDDGWTFLQGVKCNDDNRFSQSSSTGEDKNVGTEQNFGAGSADHDMAMLSQVVTAEEEDDRWERDEDLAPFIRVAISGVPCTFL